ncbi:selenium metabolism-associated LysR family transcriptional regulator [Ammoniphilus sp. CFH 90114]|uniref:selenium metabolism-associated LysR family transcriptional regulator n=1 Tax=Ammoniphilus sp. CFH 90114 TaxID=2493665 RepID=UPI00100F9065|nr:selenium metabolism-associated LysR family transcriptional regulator [Ammoniphilus sp. CFH 90114]RXT07227.1 LysR family transcriptional regulator [Ammoniphilus sp. CFH 90114]
MMNLDHLKVFYMAAIKKNFSETAKTLHLSQPTVSLQIQQLESVLDTKLFERTTKNIKLTKPGALLFQYAERIIQLEHEAIKEIALLSDSIQGNLHIGASLTIGESILPYIIGKYSKEYQGVSLNLEIFNSTQIIQWLKQHKIDLGFIESPIHDSELVHIPFMEDELVVISSTKDVHPLIGDKEVISPEELFALPLILREPGSGTRQVMEESLRKHKLNPSHLNIVLELGNTESIKASVESGMALSIISHSSIQKELLLGTLRKIRIEGITILRYFYAVYDKHKRNSLVEETFLDFLFQTHNPSSFSKSQIEYLI